MGWNQTFLIRAWLFNRPVVDTIIKTAACLSSVIASKTLMLNTSALALLARIASSLVPSGPGRRQRKPANPASRTIRYETLEVRRLLVSEGEPFEIAHHVDTTGLLGNVSAQVRWGDGTQTSAAIDAQPTRGNVKIRFDYSLDTSGFFSGVNESRRVLLQMAADTIVASLADDLDAIRPNAAGKLEWIANFTNPTTGISTLNSDGTPRDGVAQNLQVNANEIVIFAGARDLPGFERGRGGPGGYAFPNPGQLTPQEFANITAFRDAVQFRGETGAAASPATDFGPWGGSIAFDNNSTQWFFNKNIDGIQPGQTDFITVAMHELTHVLGFGNAGINKSWATFASASEFNGPAANEAYVGSGNPPLNQSAHWADSILTLDQQLTLMRATLSNNERQTITPLDVAALDDIGWTVVDSTVTVSANHVYGDDGIFPVEMVLTGSIFGELVVPVTNASVTNVKPSLTVAANQAVVAKSPLSISNIGSISDPGFRVNNTGQATDEAFDFSINWGDGSGLDSGVATIDQVGNASRPTLASFDGLHTFENAGNFIVTLRVDDRDGGVTEESFTVTVTSPPTLTLALDKTSIVENEGSEAAKLTITRSGPVSNRPLTVQLTSSDTSEATVPDTATIPAGATSVNVIVAAVDDALLDGTQSIELSATGGGVDPAAVDLIVKDHETLEARFTAASVNEGTPRAVQLRLTRSNSDTAEPLSVRVSGGDARELGFDGDLTIAANQTTALIDLMPIQDNDPEPTLSLSYSFSATGYVSDSASIDLVDDEAPFFQNPVIPFDVDGNQRVTASDALAIINELQFRVGSTILDPEKEQPDGGVFYDVNGDYLLTAFDALLVINELSRQTSGQGESIQPTEHIGHFPTPIHIDGKIRDTEVERSLTSEIAGLLF